MEILLPPKEALSSMTSISLMDSKKIISWTTLPPMGITMPPSPQTSSWTQQMFHGCSRSSVEEIYRMKQISRSGFMIKMDNFIISTLNPTARFSVMISRCRSLVWPRSTHKKASTFSKTSILLAVLTARANFSSLHRYLMDRSLLRIKIQVIT